MRFKAITLGFVLAGTALGSAALTLGRARGAAWIGQPLELMVPVQMDPGQTDGALCAEADVFHGDSRQDSSRIQVTVMPTDQADTFNLKISSTALVDEPVVTVYLRAGCSQKSSRKYVLLADFPNESAAPLSRTATPSAPQVPLVIPVQSAPLQATPVPAPAQPSPPVVEVAPKAPIKNTKASASSSSQAPKVAAKASAKEAPKEAGPQKENASKPAEAAKPATSGKPRLRLDPIETLNERVKTLESSTTGPAVQADLARDDQKVQALQGDLKTLLDQAVKNEASLMAMRERLEKAEADRVPMALVYGLAAMVLLCLVALIFLWTRRPRNPAWEQPAQGGPGAPAAAGPALAPQGAPNQQEDVHVDLVDMDDESFDRFMGQSEAGKRKL